MKRAKFPVPWKHGLHLRQATLLVKCSREFRSSILLRVNERLADARSIIAVMLLSASCGAMIDLEVSGDDEEDALDAICAFFGPENPDSGDAPVPDRHHPI